MEYRSQPLGQSRHFARRCAISVAALALVFGAIAARVAWLTLVRGKDYAAAAESNLQTMRRLDAPRGNILDRNGNVVALNRRAYSVTYSRYRQSREQVHGTLGRLTGLFQSDMLSREEEILATQPSWTRLTLERRRTESEVVAIMERPDDFHGVRLKDDFRREYPYGVPLAPVVGYVGKIMAEDVARFAPPLYLADDFVGRSGIERQYEAQLVGKPGRERHTRDARGKSLEEPVIEQHAYPGDDIVLALDADLQVRAYELLRGQTGAAVLMDVHTGDVLVLACTPAFDPDAPGRAEVDGRAVSFLNRAYRGGYPPGSTFKLMTTTAAMRRGYDPNRLISCGGKTLWPGSKMGFWCDARSGHGPLNLVGAIAKSCNTTFYQLAYDMGPEPLKAEAELFGFGRATGIDLPGEIPGTVMPNGVRGAELFNFAIGQGAFVSTPLQVAVSYAAFANGGELLKPRMATRIIPGNGGEPIEMPVLTTGHVDIPRNAHETLDEGFFRVVNDRGGTAARAAFPAEWRVCGKTGTADNSKGSNDAWFACYLPRENPELVAVVVIEDTDDHGGDIAAPIARDIIRAWRGEAPGAVAMATK